MKKLLIATLAAAAAGMTFADDLCNESSIGGSGCAVYNVKFNLKTLAAKKSACGELLLANSGRPSKGATAGGEFGIWTRFVAPARTPGILPAPTDGYEVSKLSSAQIQAGTTALMAAGAYPGSIRDYQLEQRQAFWVDNATRTWEGIIWQCTSQCIDGVGGQNDREFFVMWEKKAKRAVSYPAFRAWNKDKASYRWFSMNYNVNNQVAGLPANQTYFANESSCFWFLGRYGQKAQKVAVGWNPTCFPNFGLHAAGFGSFYSKGTENRMTSVTGNCVGLIAPLVAGDEENCEPRIFVQVAYVCQTFAGWCCDRCYYATSWVPAYGTWSLRYNASLSKGKKPLSQIIPSYAVFSPENYNVADAVVVAAVAAASGTAVDNTVTPPKTYPTAVYSIDSNGIFAKEDPAGTSKSFDDAELDALAVTVIPAFNTQY